MTPFDNTFYSISQADALYTKAEEHLGKERLNDLIEEQQKHGLYALNHSSDAMANVVFGCLTLGLFLAMRVMAIKGGAELFSWVFLLMSIASLGVIWNAVKSWRGERLKHKKEIFAAFYLQQQTQGWSAQQIRDLKRTQEFHACEKSQFLLENMADETEKQTLPSVQDLLVMEKDWGASFERQMDLPQKVESAKRNDFG